MTNEFGGKVVDDSHDVTIVEITGVGEKLDRAIQAVPKEIIFELVRSGVVGLATGNTILKLESM